MLSLLGTLDALAAAAVAMLLFFIAVVLGSTSSFCVSLTFAEGLEHASFCIHVYVGGLGGRW